MTNKIVRANGTAIPSIKNVVYTSKVNATEDLRPGCVSSAMIEVEVYGSQLTAPSYGEPLTYYTVDSEGNETYIGTFYAEPSIQSRATYSFVAFDVVDKLNVGFSERLLAIQENFPMTLADLVSEACTVAGVTLATTNFPMASTTIKSFYVENIKCKDILSYAAEIACRFVRCDANEQIIFDWYALDNAHRIYPTSGSSGGESYVAYKQNGLNYQNYSVANPGCVAVKPLGTENAAYIYPDSYEAAYAEDPLGNGVITLYNLIAVDDGNGGISLSGGIADTDTGNGNVEMEGSGSASADNALVIANNILLTNADSATMSAIAQHIYTEMLTVPVYRPATAQLFPSENPYRAGDIAKVTDIQGVSFSMPIMSYVVTQAAAKVEATGNESYDAMDYGTDTAKQLRNLSNSIVQIDRLKVGYAEIDTAVIDSLEANGINADWINVGKMSVALVDFSQPRTDLIYPIADDPSTLLNTQSVTNEWITDTYQSGGKYKFRLTHGSVENIRGQRVTIAFEYDSTRITTMTPSGTWSKVDGEEIYTGDIFGQSVSDIAAGTPPSISEDGNVSGNVQSTEDGAIRNEVSFEVGNDWDTVNIYLDSTTQAYIRDISVYTGTNEDFSLGYGNNNYLGYNGLKIGLLVIDKTGNLQVNGKASFTDGLSVDGVINQVGDLDDLDTTDKSDVVSAINEVKSSVPTIGYVDDSEARSTITLTNGYASVVPTGLPTGAKVTSIAIISYTSASGGFNIMPYGANATYGYVIGDSGTTIDGLRLRFWYEVGV